MSLIKAVAAPRTSALLPGNISNTVAFIVADDAAAGATASSLVCRITGRTFSSSSCPVNTTERPGRKVMAPTSTSHVWSNGQNWSTGLATPMIPTGTSGTVSVLFRGRGRGVSSTYLPFSCNTSAGNWRCSTTWDVTLEYYKNVLTRGGRTSGAADLLNDGGMTTGWSTWGYYITVSPTEAEYGCIGGSFPDFVNATHSATNLTDCTLISLASVSGPAMYWHSMAVFNSYPNATVAAFMASIDP